jgi:hypothetical protein
VYQSANHGYLINIDHTDYYYYSEHYNIELAADEFARMSLAVTPAALPLI